MTSQARTGTADSSLALCASSERQGFGGEVSPRFALAGQPRRLSLHGLCESLKPLGLSRWDR